jgi:outer membrane biosynthesis protein TonB
MPGFKDALKDYKNRTAAPAAPAAEPAPVPVNPPEAAKVLETQTEPETEGKAEPAPLEVAKPKAARAPRGSSTKSDVPTESTASAPATGEAPSGASRDDLVEALVALGYTVTLTKGPK